MGELARTVAGTALYMSPEIIAEIAYDCRVCMRLIQLQSHLFDPLAKLQLGKSTE